VVVQGSDLRFERFSYSSPYFFYWSFFFVVLRAARGSRRCVRGSSGGVVGISGGVLGSTGLEGFERAHLLMAWSTPTCPSVSSTSPVTLMPPFPPQVAYVAAFADRNLAPFQYGQIEAVQFLAPTKPPSSPPPGTPATSVHHLSRMPRTKCGWSTSPPSA
jgi:hypothetical protein